MSEEKKNLDYDEIDEAEEEALLKSDDEVETTTTNTKMQLSELKPPVPLTDEDSLILADDLAPEGVKVHGDHDIEESSDDEDLDDNEKTLRAYKEAIKDVEENSFAYDKYIRLCEVAHETGELEYIRFAYTRFAKVYPLSPELWLKYLNIELTVTQTPTEIQQLELLFRQALNDYFSIDVALLFGAFAERCADPMSIWNELCGTYGLNCLHGQEFFKNYRVFLKNNNILTKEEQKAAYVKSFLLELQYPIENMAESYIEFKVYFEKNKPEISRSVVWDKVDNEYYRAKEHLEKILGFEKKLLTLQASQYRERAEIYSAYVKETDKFLNENVLQTVYERMVADCCLNPDCWLIYIEFLEHRDRDRQPAELQALPVFLQTAMDITKKALRNCSWSEKLYIKKMQLLETLRRPREEIQEVLENAVSVGFQTPAPAVAVWLEYLTYLRRHTDWHDENSCDILRKNFNLAWNILGQQWGVLADCNCEILQFWGRLEYGPLQDAQRGKDLWTTVMESSDNGTKSGLWIEFTQLEMRRDLNSTRNLYRTALQNTSLDNPCVIASAWERFERCNGSIKTLNDCKKTCSKMLDGYYTSIQYCSQQPEHKNKQTSKKGIAVKRKATDAEEMPVALEKKSKQMNTEVESNAVLSKFRQGFKEATFKEHENHEIDFAKDHLRIFLSNLDYNLNEDEICKGLPELKIVKIDLIRAANGRSRGFGYIELESAVEVAKALKMDGQSLNGRPLYISSVLRDKERRQKFKYSDSMEPKKLFIKGLPNDTNKEELEKIYMEFGKLSDVRLVHHKSGKFKNIAYVEFVDREPAGKAVLATNNMEIRGHNICVAISAPPPKNSANLVKTNKILGLSTKRTKAFDQKPRMSLIPNVVRKKYGDIPVSDSTASATNGTSIKSNEDFRKLLNN